ncbi:MAG: hypothetical protein HY775_04705, partial [Acidobacteria bacterium]|nr:hypothetical protein [Acidobacteriota bacterium]
ESYLLQVGGYLASQGAYRLTLNEGDWTRVGVPLIGRVEGGTDGDHARACLTSRFVASFCEGTDGAAG